MPAATLRRISMKDVVVFERNYSPRKYVLMTTTTAITVKYKIGWWEWTTGTKRNCFNPANWIHTEPSRLENGIWDSHYPSLCTAATVSAQLVQNWECPYGTRATPVCGAMRHTLQLSTDCASLTTWCSHLVAGHAARGHWNPTRRWKLLCAPVRNWCMV